MTGNGVTAYGLAVEHYQKYEVIWSGQNGTEIFFENENPYDPPRQSAWMAKPSQKGYPALLVTSNVTSFHGYGMGSYSFFNQAANIHSSQAFEAPKRSNVQFHNIFTVFLSTKGFGGIDSVINGVGGPSTIAKSDSPIDVGSYP